MGKIFGFLFILGGIIFGSYLSDWGLGDDVGYTVGFIVGLVAFFIFMPWFRKTTKTDRVSREIAVLDKYRTERKASREKPQQQDRPSSTDTKECPFCAETIKAKAIVCRYCGRDLPKAESEEVSQKVVEYYKAIQGILTEHVIETGTTGETLNSLMLVDSSEARMKEERIYNDRLEAAKHRLQKVKDLNPPNEILAIHQAYLKAFTVGVEARREESRGNHFKASAAYQISSDELSKTVKMWEELGVT